MVTANNMNGQSWLPNFFLNEENSQNRFLGMSPQNVAGVAAKATVGLVALSIAVSTISMLLFVTRLTITVAVLYDCSQLTFHCIKNFRDPNSSTQKFYDELPQSIVLNSVSKIANYVFAQKEQ